MPSRQFGREEWLARTASRRQEEWKEKHADELIKISPMMMHQLRQGRLATPDYQRTVHAFRKNDGSFTTWMSKNIKRRDPAFNPYKHDSFYTYSSHKPKAYQSLTKQMLPTKLPPIVDSRHAGASAAIASTGPPLGQPLKRTFSTVKEVHYEEDNGGHVDRASAPDALEPRATLLFPCASLLALSAPRARSP